MEKYIANSGYRDNFGKDTTPTGYKDFFDRIQGVVCAQHEVNNHRFKKFRCLHKIYCHKQKDHYFFFALCALMVELRLLKNIGTYDVECTFETEIDQQRFLL